MNINELKKLIEQGEGIAVEFKEARNALSKDVFESVCAFLNRNGGHLFLGVNDEGKITGICEQDLLKIKTDLVVTLNNPQKMNPPLYVLPEECSLHGQRFVHVYIPESSQVHRCNGNIFDRNEDGDLNKHHETSRQCSFPVGLKNLHRFF